MIVPMKKISLISLASDASATLTALHELGILHLTHVNEPESDEQESTSKQVSRINSALDILTVTSSDKNRVEPSATIKAAADKMPPKEIVDRIQTLVSLRKEFTERIIALREEERLIEPYGNYNPALIDELATKGINVKLYQSSEKHHPEAPEGVYVFPLSNDGAGKYYAAVSMDEFECDVCEYIPHHRPLSVVAGNIAQAEKDIDRVNQELMAFAQSRATLENYLHQEEQELSMLEARDGIGLSGKLVYLNGFCPEPQAQKLRDAANKHGWGLVINEPSDDDQVPTILETPKWVSPIKSLLDMIEVLPGYKEVDISSIFLLGFSLFFAILVGDAGYGLIFLILTILARMKMKKAPATPFNLMYILSTCTIIWGVISGNYFGVSFSALPAPLAKLGISYEWLSHDNNFMMLCFLIGAIHLTIAHAWRLILTINSTRAIAQVGWIIMTWCMYFGANHLVLGADLPGSFNLFFVPALLMIILFMTPLKRLKAEWNSHIILPFDVINNFVDVVSYVRLFAVGSASLAVAISFNELAIGNGIDSVFAGLGAALILFLGHAMNLVLCVMGVLVHGIRLNALEFSGHIGLEWSGFKYNPFKKAVNNE